MKQSDYDTPLLEVKNLVKTYQGKNVVNDLSFKVGFGQVVGLLGPNGAGKTTAFYITMGFIKPKEGSIIFNGQDITNLSVDKRAKLGMGYLPQEPSIFKGLTVEENILSILQTLPLNKKQQTEKLNTLLKELSLSHLKKKKSCTLSGGERRRLEITRALVTNPRLLLLDEPFANIDPLTIRDVKIMIKHLISKGISVLITDHNAKEVSSIVDVCYLIQEGHVSHHGSMQQILANATARSTYFGDDFVLS